MSCSKNIISNVRKIIQDSESYFHLFTIPKDLQGILINTDDKIFNDDDICLIHKLAIGEINSVPPISNLSYNQIENNSVLYSFYVKFVLIHSWLRFINWLARNELDYSVGGVSLNLTQKTDRYMSLIDSLKSDLYDRLKEYKNQMVSVSIMENYSIESKVIEL